MQCAALPAAAPSAHGHGRDTEQQPHARLLVERVKHVGAWRQRPAVTDTVTKAYAANRLKTVNPNLT